MARPVPKIDANSDKGRILLALRAGPMFHSELVARFANWHSASKPLRDSGLVVRKPGEDAIYMLTDAGRESCPTRRAAA